MDMEKVRKLVMEQLGLQAQQTKRQMDQNLFAQGASQVQPGSALGSLIGNPLLHQIGTAIAGGTEAGMLYQQHQINDPNVIDQIKRNANVAAETKEKQREESRWEGFQQGIRMATQQLLDQQERGRAWDSYVLGLLARGFAPEDAIRKADDLLSERDGRFSAPKN